MTRSETVRAALAPVSSGMLVVAAGLPLMGSPRAAIGQTSGEPAAAETAQQRPEQDQATQQATEQAVSNALQQTENLEFQTLNEERPPSFQQIEP